MFRLIILILLSNIHPLFAYDTLTILDKESRLQLISAPALLTGTMTADQAYENFKSNQFRPLPSQARSLGYNSDTIWIGLELANLESQKLYLKLKNSAQSHSDCFIYQGGKQIHASQNDGERFKSGFMLREESIPTVYLIKIHSVAPLIVNLQIGTQGELESAMIPDITLYTFFATLFFSLILYNLFFYLTTKKRIYILYTLHVFSFFIFITIAKEYLMFFTYSASELQNTLSLLAIQGTFTLLILFTLDFFELKNASPLLYKNSLIIAAVGLFFYPFIFLEGYLAQLSTLFVVFEALFCIYLGIVALKSRDSLAVLYLSGLGLFLAGHLFELMMIYGFLPFTYITHAAFLFGAVGEIFIFSLAINYKIKNLLNNSYAVDLENKANNKMLFLQSRYASMGETVGNIAHQWKQPLHAIGSIQSSIKAALIYQGDISKKALLHSVDTSFKLLHHLSDTIDTFYRFLSQQSSNQSSFIISDEFDTIRKITQYSFENSQIELRFILNENPTIEGSANEFTHALLNLILNAKDALENFHPDAPMITVQVDPGEKNCTITVTDNAGGIKINPIHSIFDKHISSKAQEHGGGMGMGLYMTKNIIEERFGGTISVANRDDGACFTIALPYADYAEHFHPVKVQDEQQSLAYIKQLTHKIIELEEVEKTLTKWADIFKHAHWGIAIHVGHSHKFELTNAAFHALYGYTPDELKTITVSDLFAPQSLDLVPKIEHEAFEKGYAIFEALHQRKDGSLFPVSIELIVVKDEKGEVLYHIANIWDLTETKADQERLLLKKFALDHIQDAVYLVDEQANFHYVNEATCQTLGYSREELEQMHVGDVDPDWPRERWPEHWNHLKEVGSMTMELRHKRKDGTIFPVELSANYIQFGDTHYNMGIARDITQRKAADKKLHLLDVALNNTNDAAYISIDLNIIQVNDGACKMLGFSREELTSMTLLDIDPEATKEELNALKSQAMESNIRFERTHKTKAGKILDVEIVLSFFEYEGVMYSFAAVRDITEQKEAKENLLLKEYALDKINESVFLIDKNSKFHYVNEGASHALGYTKEELLTMGVIDIDPSFQLESWKSYWESVKKIGTTFLSTQHKRKDGTLFPIEISSSHIEYNGVWYRLAVSRDITERLLLEAEKENRIIRTITENSPDIIVRFDTQGRRTYLNPKAQELFSIDQSLLMGKTLADVTPVINKEFFETNLKNVITTGVEASFETSYLTASGKNGWAHMRMVPEFDSDGVISSVLSIGRDITDRKQMEKELENSYNFLNEIVNAIPDPIFVKDRKHRLILVNDTTIAMSGMSKEELIGKSDYDIFPKEQADIFWEKDEEVFESREVSINEEYNSSADGVTYYLQTVKSAFVSADGVEYLVGVVRDITERKQMELSLEKNRASLAEAQRVSHTGSWELDINANVLSWSDEIFRIFEIDKNEFSASYEAFLQAIHPDDRDMVNHAFAESLEKHIPYEIEHRLLMSDGRVKHVLERGETQYSDEGKPLSTLGIVHDITERKEMEASLKDAHDRYIQILDNSIDVIYLVEVTSEGHFIYVDVNAAYEEVTGIPRDVVIGLDVEDIEHETFRTILIDKFTTCLNAGEKTDYTADYPFPAGLRTFHSVLLPIRDESGRIVRIVGVARDITEQKEMEEALKISEQKFRTLIENATDNIIRYDKEARITYMNPQLEKVLGISYKTVLGKTPTELISDGTYDQYEIELKRVIATGENAQVYITFPDTGNGKQYHYIQIVAERDIDDNLLGAIAFGRDVTELTNKTIELQKALEFNEGIIGAIPDLMFEVAPDGTYINVWAQNAELLVAQKEMLLGKNFKETLPPNAVITVLQTLKEVDEKGFSLGNTYSLDLHEGKKWFELSVSKQKSSGNYIVLSRDITERKELELLLEKERKFLSDAQRVAHTGSWYLDIPTGVLSWSDETYRIFELDKEQVEDLHKTFYECVHPDDREMVNAPYLETIKTGDAYEIEHRIVMRDGRIKYVIEKCEHTYDSDGTALYSVGTVQDITQRKLLENEIAHSHRFLNELVDAIPDPIFVKDRQHRWTLLNKAFCTLIGKPKDTLLGKSDYDFFPKAEADIFWEKDEEVFVSNTININEEGFTSSDNITHMIQTVKSMFFAENGEEFLVGSIRDITERKQMETALEENRRALAEAQKLSHIGSWKMDLQTGAFTWSDEYFRILEIDPEEMEKFFEVFMDRVHPDDRAFLAESYAHWQETLEPYETEHRLLMPDGRVKYVLQHSETLYDEADKPRYVVGTIHDITERKEYQLHAEMIETAVRHSNDAMYILDPEEAFRFTFVNDAACRMTGYSKNELLAMTPQDLDPSPDIAYIQEVDQQFSSEKHASFESMHRRKDGTSFPVDVVGYEIHFGGKPLRITIVRDITERKEAEAKIKELNSTLERRVEERTVQLAEKEREYRTLAENLPDFLVRYDKAGRRIYVNSAFSDYFDIPSEELVGSTPETIPLAGTPSALSAKVHHVLKSAETAVLETYTKRHGETRWWNIIFTPEFDVGGEVAAVLSIAHDITAIKEAEIELREREEKFSSVFRLSPAAVSITSLERNIYLEVNDSFLFYTKYSRDEVVGHSSADLNIFVDPDARAAFFKEVTEKGFIQNFEYTYRAKDGSIGYAAAYASIITLNAEMCLLSHSYDISARKEVEILQQERLELEKRLSKIAAAAPGVNYIFESRPDGRLEFTYLAPGFEALIGLSAQTAFNDFSAVMERIHEEDRERIRQSIAATARDLTPWHEEYRIFHPQKGEIWIEGQSSPERQEDGTVVWYGFFHDVTERKVTEAAIIDLNATLERRVEERTAELQKALAFSEGIIHAIPDLLFEVDQEGTYMNVWAQDEMLLAAQREMLLGKNLRDVLPPEAAEVSFQTMEEVDQNGFSRGNVYQLDLPDGEHWFELSTSKKEPEGTYLALSRDITERKRAEEKIKELNTTLEQRVEERTAELKEALSFSEGVIHALPDILFEIDGNHTCLNVWARDESMLAAPREVLLGSNTLAALSKEAAITSRKAVAEADQNGSSVGHAIRIDLPEGPRWFELSVSKKAKNDFLVLSRDITERKEAEKELQLLEKALGSTQETVWLFDATSNGQLLYVNDGACRMLGYTYEELLEIGLMGVDKEFTPEDAQAGFEAMEQNGYLEHERVHTAKDGRRIPVEITSTLFRVGEQSYILSTARDISARKAAAAALAKSEQRYRDIFENSQDALYIIDVTDDGRFLNVDVNAAFERSTGMKREELVGRYTDETVDEATAAAVNAKYRRCVDAGMPIEEEIVLTLPAGVRTYYSVLIPVREKESDRIYRIVGVTRDITD